MELVLYHQLAVTYGRAPHEWALNRLDVPGQPVHGACLVFDVFCMRAYARAQAEVAGG